MNIKKIITIVSVILISLLMIYGLVILRQIFSSNTKFSETEIYVYIPTDSKYDDVKKIESLNVFNNDKLSASI